MYDKISCAKYNRVHAKQRSEYGKKRYAANPQKYRDGCKRYNINNRDKLKNYRLKAAYGISLAQFEQMIISQDDKCAICEKEMKCHKNRHMDHSHITGKIRALLCANCNAGIGNLKDNLAILRKAVAYIEKWGE